MTPPKIYQRVAVRLIATIAAVAIASCSSSSQPSEPTVPPQTPVLDFSKMKLTPAASDCNIDAVKMCQQTSGYAISTSQQPSSVSMPSSYGPSNVPETVEFQIPAGQAIKLMCYYDPQHQSVYRADATPESALTQNSVEYLKQRGYCTRK